jgi:hypothetical protein
MILSDELVYLLTVAGGIWLSVMKGLRLHKQRRIKEVSGADTLYGIVGYFLASASLVGSVQVFLFTWFWNSNLPTSTRLPLTIGGIAAVIVTLDRIVKSYRS